MPHECLYKIKKMIQKCIIISSYPVSSNYYLHDDSNNDATHPVSDVTVYAIFASGFPVVYNSRA